MKGLPCVERGSSKAERLGKLRKRKHGVRGIIVHTTGSGPWVRWNEDRERYGSPFDAAREVYEERSILGPHFLICGETGRILQLCELEDVAQHVGSKGSWRYRFPKWEQKRNFDWWYKRFLSCGSPRDLFSGDLWRRGSANELSIGIELAPPLKGPRAPWSLSAWYALNDLCAVLCSDLGTPRDRYHIITHSDAHPLKRSTSRGRPWDPGRSQWTITEASHYLGLE